MDRVPVPARSHPGRPRRRHRRAATVLAGAGRTRVAERPHRRGAGRTGSGAGRAGRGPGGAGARRRSRTLGIDRPGRVGYHRCRGRRPGRVAPASTGRRLASRRRGPAGGRGRRCGPGAAGADGDGRARRLVLGARVSGPHPQRSGGHAGGGPGACRRLRALARARAEGGDPGGADAEPRPVATDSHLAPGRRDGGV